ncbi:MAG: response regulator [bacterium]
MENQKERKNILVVDDSWISRKYLLTLFELKGYNIYEAANGLEALDILDKNVPDCIILDVLMPGMNGIELLKAIKERNILVPTIILSADIQSSTKAQCYRYGAFSFISKPAPEKEILGKLNQALNKKKVT